MRAPAALVLALLAANGRAGTAYVTDQLVLGVYADQSTQGLRLATLHSGAAVEVLGVNGDSTQVRLGGSITGWVKSAYLTTTEPAVVRIKQLQDELDRTRATTPELAEAAERGEVERLKRELAERSSDTTPSGVTQDKVGDGASIDADSHGAHPWLWLLTVVAALGGGFWLGYATLARRIRARFGGMKVY